jgi:ubiquitin-conjugating enzyme E2 S
MKAAAPMRRRKKTLCQHMGHKRLSSPSQIAGMFLTKIFHPNVSSAGDICVNVLKRDWKPDVGLRHVFTIVRCLLIEPNPESALNEEAGRLLLESFADFAKKAQLLAGIHARKPSLLTATGGANALNADGSAVVADGKTGAGGKAKAAATRGGVDKKRSLKRL